MEEVIVGKKGQEVQDEAISKYIKPFNGTRLSDSSFGGYFIDKELGKYSVEHPEKPRSRTSLQSIDEAVGYILEMRILNEVTGVFTPKEFNTRVKKIQAELHEALGLEKK